MKLEVLTKQELINLIRKSSDCQLASEDELVHSVLSQRKVELERQIELINLLIGKLKADMNDLVDYYRLYGQRKNLGDLVVLMNQIEAQSKMLDRLVKRYEQLEGMCDVES